MYVFKDHQNITIKVYFSASKMSFPPDSPPLTSGGPGPVLHTYVFTDDNDISIKIITLVPPHKTYNFDGTKLLKDLPSLITSKLNRDTDVKVFSWHNDINNWRMIFQHSIFNGMLEEEQNIDTITIAEYFVDRTKKLKIIFVPKQK